MVYFYLIRIYKYNKKVNTNTRTLYRLNTTSQTRGNVNIKGSGGNDGSLNTACTGQRVFVFVCERQPL